MISNCPSAASVFCKELNPFPLLARKMLMRYQRPNAGICEAAVIRVSNYEHLSIRRPVVNAAIGHEISACLLSLVLLFSTWTQSLRAYQDTQAPARAIQAPPHA